MKTKILPVLIVAAALCTRAYSQLINIDFKADGNPFLPDPVGPAAIGQTATDVWNLYSRDDGFGGWRESGTLSNLKQADGSATAASLYVNNAAGAWFTYVPDGMFQSYLYPLSRVGDII